MTVTKVGQSVATTPANATSFTTSVTVAQTGSLLLIAVGCSTNSTTASQNIIMQFDGANQTIVHEAGDRADTSGQGRRITVFAITDPSVGSHSVAVAFAGGASAGFTVTAIEIAGASLTDPFGTWDDEYLTAATSASIPLSQYPSLVLVGTRCVNEPDPIGIGAFTTILLNGTNQWWGSAWMESGTPAGVQFDVADAASRIVVTGVLIKAPSVLGDGYPVKVKQSGVFVDAELRVKKAGAFVAPQSVQVLPTPPASNALTWAPPTLVTPTTVTLSNSNRKLTLDITKDYIIQMPTTIDVAGGIEINGGRNIHLIGGKIQPSVDYTLRSATYVLSGNVCTVTRAAHGYSGTSRTYATFTSGGLSGQAAQNPTITVLDANTYTFPFTGADTSGSCSVRDNTSLGTTQRCVFIKGNSAQTVERTIHIEGLYGAGSLIWEFMNIDSQSEPGLTVQVQNCRVDQINTHLTASSHEGGDAIQCWNGPKILRVDRMTVADAGYQGIFLQPKQFGTGPVLAYHFKNMHINGAIHVSPSGTKVGQNSSAYLLWHSSSTTVPITVEDVYVQKNPSKAWPNDVIWPKDGNVTWGAIQGAPPDEFCPASLWTGGYVSPGYL